MPRRARLVLRTPHRANRWCATSYTLYAPVCGGAAADGGRRLRSHRRNRQLTRSSAIAEGPRDASCQLKSCQLPRNSAETTCTTSSPEQIEVMKLEGYSGPMSNKHVHSTVTPSSRFHCPIGVINKPTTDRVVDITCMPTTCCKEIF